MTVGELLMFFESTTSSIPIEYSEHMTMKTNTTIDGHDVSVLGCQDAAEVLLFQRVYRVIMITVMAIACACLSRMADGQTPPNPGELTLASHGNMHGSKPVALPAAGQTVSHTTSHEMNFGSETDCSCRNVPGGFPCTGGCQPCIQGVDCASTCGPEATWDNMRPLDFNSYAHGGYAGPARLAHLSHYRLRPRDQLQVIYLITRRQGSGAYRLEVGDEVLIESVSDVDLTRGTLLNGL